MLLISSLLLAATAVTLLLKKRMTQAAICAVLLLTLAALRPFLQPSISDRAARFDRKNASVLATGLARKVVERHPGKRIALVVGAEIEGLTDDAGLKQKEEEDRLAGSFRKLGAEPIVTPLPLDDATRARLAQARERKSDDPDFSPELAYYTAKMTVLMAYGEKEIGDILRQLNGKADIVVWMPPLSATLRAVGLPARGSAPDLVLLKARIDDPAKALQQSVLDMYLTYRPDASWELDYQWPANDQEAFDHRYAIASRDEPAP